MVIDDTICQPCAQTYWFSINTASVGADRGAHVQVTANRSGRYLPCLQLEYGSVQRHGMGWLQ